MVTSKEDLWRFIRLIPNWKRVAVDLDLIYLAAEIDWEADGWYEYPDHPTIILSPFKDDLRMHCCPQYFDEHEPLFRRLGTVITTDKNSGDPVVEFCEDSARAFQLLHIFTHELGHHHYRITQGEGRYSGTEEYAEKYAYRLERKLWRQVLRGVPVSTKDGMSPEPARTAPKVQDCLVVSDLHLFAARSCGADVFDRELQNAGRPPRTLVLNGDTSTPAQASTAWAFAPCGLIQLDRDAPRFSTIDDKLTFTCIPATKEHQMLPREFVKLTHELETVGREFFQDLFLRHFVEPA